MKGAPVQYGNTMKQVQNARAVEEVDESSPLKCSVHLLSLVDRASFGVCCTATVKAGTTALSAVRFAAVMPDCTTLGPASKVS